MSVAYTGKKHRETLQSSCLRKVRHIVGAAHRFLQDMKLNVPCSVFQELHQPIKIK